MFDIMVVALLLALTVVAVTRFPAEGRSTQGRFVVSRGEERSTCPECRAAVHETDGRCVTCGEVLV